MGDGDRVELRDHMVAVGQAVTALQTAMADGTDQEIYDLAHELSEEVRSFVIAADKEGVE